MIRSARFCILQFQQRRTIPIIVLLPSTAIDQIVLNRKMIYVSTHGIARVRKLKALRTLQSDFLNPIG